MKSKTKKTFLKNKKNYSESESDSEENPQKETETKKPLIGALDVDDDINVIFCKDSKFK